MASGALALQFNRSLPPDLPTFVLFLQPALQWLEVFGHRTGGDILPGRFLQNLPPVLRAALFQNIIQPRPDFLVVGIVTGLRRLMQEFAGDVVVQLKLKHGGESVIVIVSGVIVNVRLGCGIAPFFAPR
jgi:hypothetical protein